MATRLAPADSLHLTGYPGDLKFPGRSAQYLPIFLLVAARPAFVCSFVLLRQLRMEVPPPCCYLMTRGGVGEANNPAGGARGGWRSEGGREFFPPRCQDEGGGVIFTFAINL